MIEPVVDIPSHQKALRRIEELWNAKAGSREERELDALATLVDTYERRAFPIEKVDAIEAIQLRCDQLGWNRKQLEPLIGTRARVSEVLSGRRALTLPMIRRLHQALGIAAEILILDSRLRSTSPLRRPKAPTAQKHSNALGERKRTVQSPKSRQISRRSRIGER